VDEMNIELASLGKGDPGLIDWCNILIDVIFSW